MIDELLRFCHLQTHSQHQLCHWRSFHPDCLRRRARRGHFKSQSCTLNFPAWPSLGFCAVTEGLVRDRKNNQDAAIETFKTIHDSFLSFMFLRIALDKCKESIPGDNHVFYNVFLSSRKLPNRCGNEKWKHCRSDVLINDSGDKGRVAYLLLTSVSQRERRPVERIVVIRSSIMSFTVLWHKAYGAWQSAKQMATSTRAGWSSADELLGKEWLEEYERDLRRFGFTLQSH